MTWSAPIQVNQTPNTIPPIDRQAWNPAVAVAANGTVAVSYYDFRNNTAAPGTLTDYWLATVPAPATNPSTWSEVRLTNSSFNLEQAPTRFNGGFFLGDYEGLAAAGNDFVAVWGMPDGSATAQESIFFRRASSGAPLQAAAVGHNRLSATLTAHQVDGLLPEALHRWQAAGIATSILYGVDMGIADLYETTLDHASGHAIGLDGSSIARSGDMRQVHLIERLTVQKIGNDHRLGHIHDNEKIASIWVVSRRTPNHVILTEPGLLPTSSMEGNDLLNLVLSRHRVS